MTAHCCRSPTERHAAVRPVIPAIRCNREIKSVVNSQIADKTDLELSEVNGCFGRAAKVSMGSTRFNLEHGELHRVPNLMVNKVGSFDLSIK